MTIWLGESVDAETSSCCTNRVGAGTPGRAIERHQRINLSSPYPSRYCILIGLEKPLSDSLWNDSFDLGNRLMLKLQVAVLELVLALQDDNRGPHFLANHFVM